MYAVIRAYNGNFDLADTLAEHEEEIRQLIGGINGFRAYYLLKLAEGTSTISVFDDQEGAVVEERNVRNRTDFAVCVPVSYERVDRIVVAESRLWIADVIELHDVARASRLRAQRPT